MIPRQPPSFHQGQAHWRLWSQLSVYNLSGAYQSTVLKNGRTTRRHDRGAIQVLLPTGKSTNKKNEDEKNASLKI